MANLGGQTISADSQDAVGNTYEYRLWQQINWRHHLLFGSFSTRSRLEERKSLSFSNWAYRFRQRIGLNKPLSKNLSLIMANEIFFNLNNVNWIITNWLDQNRALLGIEQRMTEKTYLAVGYMNQYLSTPVPQYNHVLWINWRIDLEKR